MMNSNVLVALLFSLFSFLSFGQVVSIGSPSNAVEGSGNPVSFLISLDNGAINTTGSDITGTLNLTGTATPGVDYLAPMSFAIPNGANSVGLLIPVVDDAACESTETVDVTIASVSVGTINPANATSSTDIFDDDCGSIVISITSPVDATEGTSDVTFDIQIVVGGPTPVPITGTIGYGGNAIDGVDYSGVYSYTIATGTMGTTITVPVIDDTNIEGTEQIIPTLTGSPSFGTYANTSVTANIFDDDAASVSISIGSPVNGTEGSTFASYVVSLDGGIINNTGAPITGSINYSGTATDGADYVGVTSFSIPDGVGASLVTLVVNDDLLFECTETVTATISNPNLGFINPTNASSTADIIDDECSQGTISIGSPVDGAEGGSDVSFVVSLDNGAINSTGTDIYGMLSFGGTADPSDYSGAVSAFIIPDGASSDTIVLNVNDDTCIEYTESVEATISTPSVGSINNGTSTANILDNDLSVASVSINNPSDGAEGGADVSFVISIDNGLTNCTGAPITGSLTFSGTATAGLDYSNINSFSIPDGSSFIVHTLPVIDDADDECDETVIATISSVLIGTINIDTSTAIIVDDDCTIGLSDLVDLGISIYPNPTVSSLKVSADQHMSSYSLIDLNGRIISSGRIDAKEIEVSTEFLSSGSYFLEIQFENGSRVSEKILKE